MRKLIFYYIRFALIIHLLVLISLPFYFYGSASEYKILEVIFWVSVCVSFPVFFILPGIIYDGNYKSSYHGFTPDQLKYNLFLGLTLGLGPLIMYFTKYDKDLKKLIKKNN